MRSVLCRVQSGRQRGTGNKRPLLCQRHIGAVFTRGSAAGIGMRRRVCKEHSAASEVVGAATAVRLLTHGLHRRLWTIDSKGFALITARVSVGTTAQSRLVGRAGTQCLTYLGGRLCRRVVLDDVAHLLVAEDVPYSVARENQPRVARALELVFADIRRRAHHADGPLQLQRRGVERTVHCAYGPTRACNSDRALHVSLNVATVAQEQSDGTSMSPIARETDKMVGARCPCHEAQFPSLYFRAHSLPS